MSNRMSIFPHIFVWGSCFWFCIPSVLPSSRRPAASTAYSHTTCSHTACSHTTCSHTTCSHTACSHTTCSHTTCSHRTCTHTTCSHTTCSRNLHTQLAHTQLAHTQLAHTELAHTQLTHTQWQAWRFETSIFVSRGRRGTYGTGLALVARSVPTCPSGRRGFLRGRRGAWRHSSSFHVAGVALGDIHLRFTWQAWYSTYSLCVAGVARMALG